MAGALAGYAIAIPVGAIAVLIVEVGIRRGFWAAAAAGAGAAAADGIYASLAVVGGTALAAALEPVAHPLRVVAVGALLGIGLRGLALIVIARRAPVSTAQPSDQLRGTFLRFLALTLLNPATMIYFAALILAVPHIGRGPVERAAFAAGAFLASLSWQTALAGISAVAHRRLPAGFRVGVSLIGNLAICGFALILAGDL